MVGYVLIPAEKWRLVWTARRTTWPSPLRGSGRLPRGNSRWNSTLWLLCYGTCARALMALFSMPYERTCDQRRSRYQSLAHQGNRSEKTEARTMSSGRSSEACCLTRKNSVWLTCSSTAASSPGRLCISVQESSVRWRRSIICEALFSNGSCGMPMPW